MGAEFVVADAADLILLNDFAQDARDFALDGLRGQFALDEGEKLLEGSVALGVLELRFCEVLEPLADFRAEGFEGFAGFDFFGERVIERRELLGVDTCLLYTSPSPRDS